MKLTKAQTEVLEKAKEKIDFARNNSFFKWYMQTPSNYVKENIHTEEELENYLKNKNYNESIKNRIGASSINALEIETKIYEMYKNGFDCYCHATKGTIKKLESLGLIKIIEDSSGAKYYGFDIIKIINY